MSKAKFEVNFDLIEELESKHYVEMQKLLATFK